MVLALGQLQGKRGWFGLGVFGSWTVFNTVLGLGGTFGGWSVGFAAVGRASPGRTCSSDEELTARQSRRLDLVGQAAGAVAAAVAFKALVSDQS